MSSKPSQTPVSLQLTEVFWQFNAAFQRWAETQVQQEGVTSQRMRILYALQDQGELKMRDLKEHLGVTATNITALVSALEKEQLVTRRTHPTDRRAILIALTPLAQKLLTTSCATFRERVATLFATLSDAEAESLLCMLAKLKDELHQRGQ
jgi:DNA-binding MarR family transcriptional regulator